MRHLYDLLRSRCRWSRNPLRRWSTSHASVTSQRRRFGGLHQLRQAYDPSCAIAQRALVPLPARSLRRHRELCFGGLPCQVNHGASSRGTRALISWPTEISWLAWGLRLETRRTLSLDVLAPRLCLRVVYSMGKSTRDILDGCPPLL